MDIDQFSKDWADGAALLMAGQPIKLQGNFVEIADAQLHHFVGAGGYQCTQLIQEFKVIYCTYIYNTCVGYYQIYFERYGCAPAESGTCTNNWYLKKMKSLCIDDIYPYYCTLTGEWIYYYIYACD
jgi:hypothetical protein